METFRKTMLITIITVLFLTSCEDPAVGLGKAIDMEAPVITLESHKNLDFVGSEFLLRGTAKDNVKVTKVTLKEERTGRNWQAILSSGGNHWSVEVSGLLDGEHVFTAQAHDERGNSSASSALTFTLTVDTQAPISIVYEPDLKSKPFLQELWPEGQKDFDTLEYLQSREFDLRGTIEENFQLDSILIELLEASSERTVVYSRLLVNGQPLPEGVSGTVWNWRSLVPTSQLTWGGEALDPQTKYLFEVRITSMDKTGNTHVLYGKTER